MQWFHSKSVLSIVCGRHRASNFDAFNYNLLVLFIYHCQSSCASARTNFPYSHNVWNMYTIVTSLHNLNRKCLNMAKMPSFSRNRIAVRNMQYMLCRVCIRIFVDDTRFRTQNTHIQFVSFQEFDFDFIEYSFAMGWFVIEQRSSNRPPARMQCEYHSHLQ